jgi:lipoprotein-anchoring transpeptidase ErfK/SrfK
MSQSSAGPRGNLLRPLLLVLLACAVIGITAWSASSYPVLASIINLGNSPKAVHPKSYAQVQIPKRADLAAPTPLPSPNLTDTNKSISSLGAIFSEINSKYILVDISEQHLYAYEGEELVYSFVASTGIENSTRVGTFSVLDKIPNAYASTWDLWMPNWLGIYYSGNLENGIHALPILSNGVQLWGGFLGSPISFGCVVLGVYESQLLYEWADIGTPVEIRW